MGTQGLGGAHSELSQLAPGAMLQAVVAMSDDAIFTCDLAGRVTSWGATAERLFGAAAAGVLEAPFEALFASHLRDEVRAVLATVLAGDRVDHFETEALCPDGMPVPVSLSMSSVFDDEGGLMGSVVIARDITEQRLAQASLAEVEARLEAGEALAHVGSWLWDVRTGTVQWSAEFYRIHGVDPLDFDGLFESYMGLMEVGDGQRVGAAMRASVASGCPLEERYTVAVMGQSARTVQVRAQPTRGSAGKATGLRGIGRVVAGPDDLLSPGPPGA